MAVSEVFIVGIFVVIFVGVNVGGSSTGVSFGPATGSEILSMRQASFLMAGFALLGGVAVGRNVVDRLGTGFVPPESFTLGASTAVLLVIGLAIMLGNILKVSTSSSQTAVAAVVGMGAALGGAELSDRRDRCYVVDPLYDPGVLDLFVHRAVFLRWPG